MAMLKNILIEAAMDNNTLSLDHLKDLHYPEAVTQLPIAPGWWLLLIVSVVSVFIAGRMVLQSIKKNRYRRYALKQLDVIFLQYNEEQHNQQLIIEINSLLKRVALIQYPHHLCASLNSDSWISFLQASVAKSVAKKAKLNQRALLPLLNVYQAQVQISAQEKIQLQKYSKLWIKKHLEYKKVQATLDSHLNATAVTLLKGGDNV